MHFEEQVIGDEKQKTICLITGMPEMLHGRRVAKGVFEQCQKYGYNVAVFASMSHLLFYVQDHANGEKNIFTLPSYAYFSGIIIDTVTLTEDATGKIMDTLYHNIKAHTDVPAVSRDPLQRAQNHIRFKRGDIP